MFTDRLHVSDAGGRTRQRSRSRRRQATRLGFAIKTAPAAGEPAAAIGEYHWGGMAGTHSWMAPAADLAGIVFTQRYPGFWHPFSHEYKRLVYSAAS